MRRAAAITIGVLVVVAMTPAQAHKVARRDPNEPNIRVDIKTVSYDHAGGRTTLLTRTREELRDRHLNAGTIDWALDTKGDAAPDFHLAADFNPFNDELTCDVYKIPNFNHVTSGNAHRGPRWVSCTFRTRRVDGLAEHFSSFAGFRGDFDDAPDILMYRHRH